MMSISIAAFDADAMAEDWQAISARITAPYHRNACAADVDPQSVCSVFYERSIAELYSEVDAMYVEDWATKTPNQAPTQGQEDETQRDGAGAQPTEYVTSPPSSSSRHSTRPMISVRWQGSIFPCVPLDRSDPRPLKEAVPDRRQFGCRGVAGGPIDLLEVVVSRPSAAVDDARPAAWGSTVAAAAATTKEEPDWAKKRPVRAKAAKR